MVSDSRKAALIRLFAARGRRWWALSGLSLGLLWIDYVTGPTIFFPLSFVIPVLLAGYYDGFRTTALFFIGLPLGRFSMRFFWPSVPWPLTHSLINFCVGVLTLGIIAGLVSKVGGLTQKINVLEGLVPICVYCHCIRASDGQWERLEAYFMKRFNASFSHGICPNCRTRQPEAPSPSYADKY